MNDRQSHREQLLTIRPFRREDIPAIVTLYRSVFHPPEAVPTSTIESLFAKLYFESPWTDSEITSLVADENGGKLTGFLGVFPRSMCFKGQLLRMAVTNNFMVEPGPRSGAVAIELLRGFFRGPHDIALTQAPQHVFKLWTALGGVSIPIYSLHWTRMLRPARYASQVLSRRKGLSWLTPVARPLERATDALIHRTGFGRYREVMSAVPDTDLNTPLHLQLMNALARDHDLIPGYTVESLDWMWKVLAEQQDWHGPLVRRAVHDSGGKPIGFYTYHANQSSTAEILQLGASARTAPQVLAHLLHDAEQRGLSAVAGRTSPQLVGALDDRLTFLRRYGSWVLVQSKDPELVDVFFRGRAYLSRLEDEWMFFRLAG